jgi:hypothetical protein
MEYLYLEIYCQFYTHVFVKIIWIQPISLFTFLYLESRYVWLVGVCHVMMVIY